jgi:hypothetical protein
MIDMVHGFQYSLFFFDIRILFSHQVPNQKDTGYLLAGAYSPNCPADRQKCHQREFRKRDSIPHE